jgi:Flp pilus assembly protein TadB
VFLVFVEFDCRSIGKRIKSALMWMVSTAVVCALVLGILYGMDHLIFCLILNYVLLIFLLLCLCQLKCIFKDKEDYVNPDWICLKIKCGVRVINAFGSVIGTRY